MGLVYVFSNPSLHGQLKVGFTINSIGERLSQLNSSTSIPTKFVVEYYVELEDSETYKIEQAAHAELERAGHHHGKEFFKCTVVDCKNAITRAIANHRVVVLHAEDAELTRQRVAREKKRIQAEQTRLNHEAELERKLSEEEQAIKERYQVTLDKIADPGRYLHWWLGFSAVFALLIYFWDSVKGISGGGFVLACIAGAVVALLARGYEESEKQQSSAYLTKLRERDSEVASVRANPRSSNLPKKLSTEQIEQEISLEQTASVAKYVGKKNLREIEKVRGYFEAKILIEHIELQPLKLQEVASAPPVKVANPALEPKAWVAWLSGERVHLTTHFDNFGADFVELAVRQCEVMHWLMLGSGRPQFASLEDTKALVDVLSDFEEERVNFGLYAV